MKFQWKSPVPVINFDLAMDDSNVKIAHHNDLRLQATNLFNKMTFMKTLASQKRFEVLNTDF